MANKVTIDVEARFVDNVTDESQAASNAVEELGKEAENAQKKIDNLSKKRAHPVIDVDNNKLLKKMRDSESKIARFAGKSFTATLNVVDKGAAIVNKLEGGLKKVAGKTWNTVVKVKDLAMAPLKKIKNMLFSMKSLVLAISAGLAAKQFVVNPIGLADAYSSAQIGFKTLLGDSRGQQMMNDLDVFAKATPFKSSEVISQTQRMLAMGWEADDIITDMTTIGDAAAATGKGEQGLQQIVTALAQIKSKGKLSTEELNQLAEAGISAKRYIAEGLGYGSGDEGIGKMTKDLEKGAIASGKAVEALLSGMKEYQGMMDKTANETVKGLWSQIEDTFEINIFRRWGQGLQDGAKKSFGSIVSLLDEAEGALESFGDLMYEIGSKASNWLADKLENVVKRVTEITGSFEFKEASFGEKIKMLWKGVITDPLKEWWEGGGRDKTAQTAEKIGTWMGETLTKFLLAIFGATDVLKDLGGNGKGEGAGASVAGSFVRGFMENFDGSAITDALADAISNVWNALPTWAKMLLGGYGAAKLTIGLGNLAGGIGSIAGNVTPIVSGIGSGLNALGRGAVGRIAGSAGAVGMGSVSGGLYTAAGTGLLVTGAGALYAGDKFEDAYKHYKEGDKTAAKADFARGAGTFGGAAAGMAIGAKWGAGIGTLAGGPVGTVVGGLIGAGLGTVVGWFAGDKIARNIEAAKYESEEMKEAIKDSEATAEELAQTFEKAKWENAKEHFGDISLSLQEAQRLADQIVWGDATGHFEKFSSATQTAEANLQSLKSAAEQADRWMWKASLGVKFNDDEKDSIKKSFDEYINSAKSFVENKHYEFTAAVSLLVDPDSESGKSIIDSGNAFYGKMQEQLDSLGSDLSKSVEIALKDGVITLDEQKEITNLQKQIAEITSKLATAEQQAEFDLIKVKFGNGNIDSESFATFMSTMQTTIDERMQANDKAFTASVSSLKLQLAEGAITQEEYDKQYAEILKGYKGTVETLQAEVKNVELQIIGEAYAKELGNDAAADLEKALQYAIDNNIDPVEITDEKLCELLNVDSLSGETAANIKDYLSQTLGHIELLEVDGDILVKVGEVKTEEDPGEKVKEEVEKTLPETVEKTVGVDISGEKNVQNTIDILAEDFDIPPEHAATVALLLTGDKEILNQIDVSQLAAEFGIPEDQAKTIIEKLTGAKSIENRLTVLSSDFGIPDSISKKISVNLTAIKGKITNAIGNISFGGSSGTQNSTTKNPRLKSQGYGRKYRGGFIGTSSAMEAFARGGRPDDGMLDGSTRFIRVNEEAPEMIIPLSSQRRDRARELWEKTGQLLGVPGFARGGRTDGGRDEGIRHHQYGAEEPAGGRSVQVEVGGITFEINVSGNNPEGITEAIKAQAAEIAETVAGIMADAFGAQFENTPVRGGVA